MPHGHPLTDLLYTMDLEKENISYCYHNMHFACPEPWLLHLLERRAATAVPEKAWSMQGFRWSLHHHRSTHVFTEPVTAFKCPTAAQQRGVLPGTQAKWLMPSRSVFNCWASTWKLLKSEKFLAAMIFPTHPLGAASFPSTQSQLHHSPRLESRSQHAGYLANCSPPDFPSREPRQQFVVFLSLMRNAAVAVVFALGCFYFKPIAMVNGVEERARKLWRTTQAKKML